MTNDDWRLHGPVRNRYIGAARGSKYILVVTDYFTKWVEIFAVPNQTAVTCAEKILNNVVARFGTPLSLHSDQGRNYESKIIA